MKRALIFISSLFFIHLCFACPEGTYSCGDGCAPKGTHCCSGYSKYCPGDKPIACPLTGNCYRNHKDAKADGCEQRVRCSR